MSTRLYLAATASPIGSATVNGTWNVLAHALYRKVVAAKNADGVEATSWTGVAGDNILDRIFISDPLSAQTISGTVVSWTASLSSSNNPALSTAWGEYEIYVVSGDGVTVRGTLLALAGSSSGEIAGTVYISYQFIPSGTALSSLAVQAGDRLVIKMGFHIQNTDGTGTGGGAWGSDAIGNPDTPTDGSTVNDDTWPWIEFSGAISFGGQPTNGYFLLF